MGEPVGGAVGESARPHFNLLKRTDGQVTDPPPTKFGTATACPASAGVHVTWAKQVVGSIV